MSGHRKTSKKVAGIAGLLLCGAAGRGLAGPPIPYATVFMPGTPDEIAYLSKVAGATAGQGERHADIGQFWFYGFSVAPGAACRLVLTLDGDALTPLPNITVVGSDNKPLPIRLQRETDTLVSVEWTVPKDWPVGTRLQVALSAKDTPFTLKYVQFVQNAPDSNGDGLPDVVGVLMRQGAPTAPLTVIKRDATPYTITQTGSPPNVGIDLQTDAIFAYTDKAETLAFWKARGYAVWTMGGARAGKEYADQHPGEIQTDANGNPFTVEGSYYLNPTENRIAAEQEFYAKAFAGGSDGVCPEEPEYFAGAGYEEAFKTEWMREYGTPWQPPVSSFDARWKASQLMAKLETNHIAGILDDAARRRPNARRLVALHSPINYANWGIVCPQYRITSLPGVQEVIGQVWTGTARTPARYLGTRQDRTFDTAYLEYSSLAQLLRGSKKRLWFLADPVEDNPNLPMEDYKTHYEETLIASLLFPDVSAYEVMPWPDRVYGRVPAAYATEINSVIAALQEMHAQTGVSGNAANPAIGVFVSDAMQWQRESPAKSDFDGVFGLTLPLLQRGIPVQMVSLDRAAEPNYLKPFKTLFLSYDFQKPLDARTQTALLDWTRRGGSLLFFGGSDPYNNLTDAWWKKAGKQAPQDDLFAQAGVSVGTGAAVHRAEPEDLKRYTTLLVGDGAEHNLKNRRAYTFDLTKFAQASGSVAVRFADASPRDGWGAWVASGELRVNGQIAASFQSGSDIENRFLVYDNNSAFDGAARFADGPNSWTYQFDNLPRNQPITLTVDMGNGFLVSAAASQPDTSRTLIATAQAGALAKTFPRLQIGVDDPITLYPQIGPVAPSTSSEKHMNGPNIGGSAKAADETTVLYALRSGGAPVWAQQVEKGLILNVGVAPGFFAGSERSAAMLRALTQYALHRAGGVYKEPGYLQLKRGKYTIIRTFGESASVDGRTINLLSPTLAVAEDREIPPRSLALLADFAPASAPRIAFVSGRVQAKIETARATRYFVRGPANTVGIARIATGGRRIEGVRATDWLGRPVGIQEAVEGDTVLLRYGNHPDGVIVYVGWK